MSLKNHKHENYMKTILSVLENAFEKQPPNSNFEKVSISFSESML